MYERRKLAYPFPLALTVRAEESMKEVVNRSPLSVYLLILLHAIVVKLNLRVGGLMCERHNRPTHPSAYPLAYICSTSPSVSAPPKPVSGVDK
jgi:hypothetical protein